MAEAPTPRFLTLPQAAARIGREELELALEKGRLLATTDRESWARCEELPGVLGFGFLNLLRADRDAIEAIRRRAPIPPKTWWRWNADGSVNWQTGEVVRTCYDRRVIFRPVLLSADVPAQVPADLPAPDRVAPKAGLIRWLENQVSELKAAGKLPDRITDCARLLERRLSAAADSDKTLRRVKAKHIENTLRTYGFFPKKRSK